MKEKLMIYGGLLFLATKGAEFLYYTIDIEWIDNLLLISLLLILIYMIDGLIRTFKQKRKQ